MLFKSFLLPSRTDAQCKTLHIYTIICNGMMYIHVHVITTNLYNKVLFNFKNNMALHTSMTLY